MKSRWAVLEWKATAQKYHASFLMVRYLPITVRTTIIIKAMSMLDLTRNGNSVKLQLIWVELETACIVFHFSMTKENRPLDLSTWKAKDLVFRPTRYIQTRIFLAFMDTWASVTIWAALVLFSKSEAKFESIFAEILQIMWMIVTCVWQWHSNYLIQLSRAFLPQNRLITHNSSKSSLDWHS